MSNGLDLDQAWSGFSLFAKVISRREKSPLTRKEFTLVIGHHFFNVMFRLARSSFEVTQRRFNSLPACHIYRQLLSVKDHDIPVRIFLGKNIKNEDLENKNCSSVPAFYS